MKVWHTSPNWIKSLSTSFANRGDGSSMEGYGIYVSIYKETAVNFLNDYRGRNGYLYSFDIDENRILDGNYTKKEDYDKVVNSIEQLTKQDISYLKNNLDNCHWLNKKLDIFDLLSKYVPDQSKQNLVLKNAGYSGIKRYENICIIDDDLLPPFLILEDVLGNKIAPIEKGERTSKRTEKNIRYFSENLEIADIIIKGREDQTLNNKFKQIVHLLTADDYIGDSYIAQDAYNMRSLIGNYIYTKDYSKERMQTILDAVDNTIILDAEKDIIKNNIKDISRILLYPSPQNKENNHSLSF